jgi:hypothetical protein
MRDLAKPVLLAVILGACAESHADQPETETKLNECAPPPETVAVQAEPIEWVGYHSEVPLVPSDFHALASGLFGPDAQAKKFIAEKEIAKGLFIGSSEEPSTPDQARITVSFDDRSKEHRKIALAPASFSVGGLFIATVDAALAKMQKDNVAKAGSGELFDLQYRLYSSQGGRISFGVKGDHGVYSLVLDVSTPTMSIKPDSIGKPAGTGEPHDSVAGTVWFNFNRDDFAYFVDHAYGKGAMGRHNFNDFLLVPHDWLRLTVEPKLDQKFVNVGFEVVGLDGKRTAFAKAPASILAGSTFENAVLSAMDGMTAQEKVKPGSSTPWEIPFYYDSPQGGGVVQVVAKGKGGRFDIAYAVESPYHALKDVPLLEYKPVEIPKEDPNTKAACDKLGDPQIVLADKGTLNLTFQASKIIKESQDLKGPLKGPISCSIYFSRDVRVDGPIAGAPSLQDFELPDADLSSPTAPVFVSKELKAGDYQVLCFQDLDGNKEATPGDPVTLPIGGDPVSCNVNPFVVEFAILYPQGR